MQFSATDSSITTNVMNAANPSSITENSPYDNLIHRKGIKISKTLACTGNGATLTAIFTLTGTVEILGLWGVAGTVTNSTTFSTVYFDLYDATAAVEITDNTGVNLSGIVAGDGLAKTAVATTAATRLNNSVGTIVDGAAGSQTVFCPLVAIKKTGATTQIRFCYTGDASTNISMNFYVRYVPLSSGATIIAA